MWNLVREVATKDARRVRFSSWSLGPRSRPPRARYSLAVERRGETAFSQHGCIRSPTHRSLLVRTCIPGTAAVPGSPQKHSHVSTLKKYRCLRFENPMDRVVRPWAKIWIGPSDSQIRFYPIGTCHIGLRKKTDPLIRSKSSNLKLGIGLHKNLGYFDVTIWW